MSAAFDNPDNISARVVQLAGNSWDCKPAFIWEPCEWIGYQGRANAWHCPRVPYIVRHCGHPTANRPYYIEGNKEPRCYYKLDHAKVAAEQLATERGELICADLPVPEGALL